MIGKYLLKKNAERFYSRDFLHRNKQGFELPVRCWFEGPYAEQLEHRFLGSQSRLHDFFAVDGLKMLLDDARQTRTGAWNAWSLLVLDEWFRQERDSASRCLNDQCPNLNDQ